MIDTAGEILPVPPLIKEGTQKPPFVKGAARSAGGFGNVAAMKRTFASRINDLLLAGHCRVRARRCPSVPTEAIFPTLQTLGPLSLGGTGRWPVRSRAGCATKPDGKRFVHYGYTSCSLRPTLKRRAQRTKPGKPGSQGASAPFVT